MEKTTDSQFKLAELYKEEEVLWKVTNQEYHNKNKRKDALSRIGEVIGLDGDDVGKKIRSMRTYYTAEKNKIRQSKKSGSGAADVKKSSWALYDFLDAFLGDIVTAKTTRSNLEDDVDNVSQSSMEEDEEEDGESVDIQQTTPNFNPSKARMTIRQPTSKKQKIGDAMISASESLKTIAAQESLAPPPQRQEEPDDDASLFGKMVTMELRKINSSRSRRIIKMKVQEMLFEAQEKEEEEERLCTRPRQPAPSNLQPVSRPAPQVQRHPSQPSSSSNYQMHNILNMDPWGSYPSQ